MLFLKEGLWGSLPGDMGDGTLLFCEPLISEKATFTSVLFKGKPWHIYSTRINGTTEGIRGPVNLNR